MTMNDKVSVEREKIITYLIILGFAVIFVGCIKILPDSEQDTEVAVQVIKGGASAVSETAQYGLNDYEDKQALIERQRELGYPDGYDPSNPVANGEFTADDWAAMQEEEAMNSMAEDAMRDYYDPEPEKTYPW